MSFSVKTFQVSRVVPCVSVCCLVTSCYILKVPTVNVSARWPPQIFFTGWDKVLCTDYPHLLALCTDRVRLTCFRVHLLKWFLHSVIFCLWLYDHWFVIYIFSFTFVMKYISIWSFVSQSCTGVFSGVFFQVQKRHLSFGALQFFELLPDRGRPATDMRTNDIISTSGLHWLSQQHSVIIITWGFCDSQLQVANGFKAERWWYVYLFPLRKKC